MKEVELAKCAVDWLTSNHWDVYQEVQQFYGSVITDIVAVRDDLVWSIECKTSFSLSVMRQASIHRTHLRSVCVPKPDSIDELRFAAKICRDYLKVGVLLVNKKELSVYGVSLLVEAPLMRSFHKQSVELRNSLSLYHKIMAQAGSSSTSTRLTPYKRTMMNVYHFISSHPGCTLKDIADFIGRGHYSSIQSAKQGLLKALTTYESGWCKAEKSGITWSFHVVRGFST